MPATFRARRAAGGFTMVELVVVIVIVGILGAVAATRFFDKASFDAAAYADQTRALLRYAQKNAVAQNRPVFVVIASSPGSSPGRIALCYNYQQDASCSGGNRVLAPGGSNSGAAATLSACGAANRSWLCEGTPSNLALAALPATSSFYFDALGRPFAGSDSAGSATSTFAGLTLRVTGDGRNNDVVVSQETGYVY